MKQTAVILLFILALLGTHSHAQEKATKQECIAKCKEAVALIQKLGQEKATNQLNQPGSTFTWKDSYVFVFETQEAKILAHPSKRHIGWSMLEYRSADNILVFKKILDNLAETDQGVFPPLHGFEGPLGSTRIFRCRARDKFSAGKGFQ